MLKRSVILFFVALIWLSSGCKNQERRNVFTGPAVAAATEAARDVAQGTMQLTAFSAYDTADLTGLEGRSFILKLPADAPPNSQLYFTHQWYVGGKAKERAEYSPQWAEWYVEKTKCWLIDIAFLKDLFAEEPSRQVLFFARFKSLDEHRGWLGFGPMKLQPPPDYSPARDQLFTFRSAPDAEIQIGQDIPLGAWFVWTKQANLADPMAIAKAAPVACVFFLRFQTEHPNEEGRSK